ncbi:carboxyl-terminal processing protease [Reichenbachiella faecimaris]|uniref:Carboxyl-terminal processing protease n=1 Tax=Reichenbachiella faecimaris TaxID=692418 RepID=A0A1W2GAL5_REIFA|nr:S41 family peptidase [Reichenbachiella faecimaris]SMD33707.1 carboxyl-terminal processing protease [Reichenbachiella faecimaris]
MKIQNTKAQIRLPLFLSIAIAAGIFIGANMTSSADGGSDLAQSLQKFREILNYVDRNYVDEVKTEDLVEKAIADMLEELDPHTAYIPKEEQEYSRSQLEGNFDGIGIEYNIFRDTIYVVAPLSGGPSERVGLLTGDKIIKVDTENVAGIGIKTRGVLDRLRGPKGTQVTVSILRKNNEDLLDFEIIRDKIPQFSVDASYMIDDEIGYIKVNRFTATTYEEFKSALDKLDEKGLQKLILDLTGNPGGYMSMAIQMADEFLPGDPMIVFTKGKEFRYNQEHRAGNSGLFEDRPLIVLIDEGSASASEIVSGAIQDNDRGLVVGRRSFGKGLVQMPIDLSDGSELRLTISRYYTPSGRSIQRSYEGGKDDYYSDIYNRYTSGELYNADSIHQNDTLKYETVKGRTVYGGGGIMPDYFIPMDTAGNSAYLNRLFTTNAIREYSLAYSDGNRAKLESDGFDKYFTDFEINEKMLKELVAVAEESGLAYNDAQFKHSKNLIKLYLKAQIARGIWNNDGFYPIYNQSNEIYTQAIQLFDQAEAIMVRSN